MRAKPAAHQTAFSLFFPIILRVPAAAVFVVIISLSVDRVGVRFDPTSGRSDGSLENSPLVETLDFLFRKSAFCG
jgi:hypothetical protein